MPLAHLRHEAAQSVMHVGQSLVRARLREEDDEIHRVTFVQRHANFGVTFETADAGPVTGARIEDDHRALRFIDALLDLVCARTRDA